jgi:hypothetical protein
LPSNVVFVPRSRPARTFFSGQQYFCIKIKTAFYP